MTKDPIYPDDIEPDSDEGRSGDQGTGRFSRLLGDLTEADFVHEEVSAANAPSTGMTEPAPDWSKIVIGVGLLIVVSGVLVWLAGQWQQGQIQQLLAAQANLPAPRTTTLDVRDSRALLLEETGDDRRVFVQEAGNPKLMLISAGDLSAQQPAFSPDGQWVAYTSPDRAAIVWTSVLSNTQASISDSDVAGVAPELRICEWTPVAWSPASDRLALFACDADAAQTTVLWFDISNPVPTLLTASVAPSADTRDLKWLTQDTLIVTTDNPASTGGNRVEQFSVP